MKEPFAKISRNAEAFWIGDIMEVEPGVYVGKVANNLLDETVEYGSIIKFTDAEVKEVRTTPRLVVDNDK